MKVSTTVSVNGQKRHNKRIWAAVKDLFFPQETLREDELLYWRERILFAILGGGLVLGLFAFVPAIIIAIKENLWMLVAFDSLIYLGALCLLIFRSINYKIRASITSLMTYSVGLYVIMSLGLLSGGPAWLFAFTVISAVLMGLRAAYMALTINGITLALIAIFLRTGQFGENYTLFTTPEKLIGAAANFLFLNAVAAVSVAVLVRGLQSAAQREKTAISNLKHERTQLIDAKEKLKSEIEERNQAEEALRESEEKYRLLVENANDAIFIIQDGFVKFHNKKTEDLTGYSGEELYKFPFATYYHHEDRDMALQRSRKSEEEGNPPTTYSVRIKKKSGEELWAELSMAFVTWEGRPATINFFRDVTQQKTLESQLQRAQKMEAIGTLAGGIAHDFNNILAAIIGYTELANSDVLMSIETKQILNEVLKAGQRATDLVKQILIFSRQSEVGKKPIQISLIIKEALKLLRPSLPTTIGIRQNMNSTSTVLANPTQIHQVIMNLCTNAYHAMRDKDGVLEVSLSDVEIDSDFTARHLEIHPGPYVKLTVSDTGHGIERTVIDHIFEPYYTTKEKGKGTGLGLAVVHGIVKDHGGSITVFSEPEKGATFNVFLPRIEGAECAVEPEGTTPFPMGKEGVLFIDDELAIVDIGGRMLERLGYKVVVRTSPIEALEAFKAQPEKFDLVITDMTMPKMTGDELAKEIMAIRPDIPIILCTGFSERITEERAKEMGIKAFVMKPFAIRDFASTIRKVLDQEKEK